MIATTSPPRLASPSPYARIRLSNRAYAHLLTLAQGAQYMAPRDLEAPNTKARGFGNFVATLFDPKYRVTFVDARRSEAPELLTAVDDIAVGVDREIELDTLILSDPTAHIRNIRARRNEAQARYPNWAPTRDINNDQRLVRLTKIAPTTLDYIQLVAIHHEIASPNRKFSTWSTPTELLLTDRTIKISMAGAVLEAIGLKYLLPNFIPANPKPHHFRNRSQQREVSFF